MARRPAHPSRGIDMNKRVYSLVWNRTLHQVVVASELATHRGAGPAASGRTGGMVPPRRPLAAALLLACLAPWPMQALAGDTNCGGSGQNAPGFNAVSCG